MNPLKSLLKACARKRHSRGFGIHSPYAFQFVNDVIRPKDYGYYAYDLIDDNASLKGNEAREAKWFVRLFVFLNTHRVLITGSYPEAATIAAKSLGKKFVILKPGKPKEFKTGDILIISSQDCNSELIDKAEKTLTPILALHAGPRLNETLCRPLEKGLLLRGRKKILLIPREEMDYVSYEINL